jgi:hypothetical protein
MEKLMEKVHYVSINPNSKEAGSMMSKSAVVPKPLKMVQNMKAFMKKVANTDKVNLFGLTNHAMKVNLRME